MQENRDILTPSISLVGGTGLTEERNCAVLVDFDNILISLEEQTKGVKGARADELVLKLLSSLTRRIETDTGRNFIIGRAFGNWEYTHDAADSLALLSFLPVHGVHKRGKSSADLELSLEAQDILLTRPDIDHFFIVGGDRDYIPIVRRIRERGRDVTVVAVEATTSGDLKKIVGPRGFIPVSDLVDIPRAIKEKVPPPPGESLPEAPEELLSTLSDDNLEKMASLLAKAMRDHDTNEIFLVPFFKNYANEAFVTLDNEQRKELLQELCARGAGTVEKRKGGGYDYSVIVVNREDPLIQSALERLEERG